MNPLQQLKRTLNDAIVSVQSDCVNVGLIIWQTPVNLIEFRSLMGIAEIAQLVEHCTETAGVPSSSLGLGIRT